MTTFVAVLFVVMGVVALIVPERISVTFGTESLTPAGRNEVRAVYGGFGVAIGALLVAAPSAPQMTAGIYLSVAVALFGMATGRVVSALVERPGAFYPAWFYCAAEALGAVVLLRASGAL